MLDQLIDFPCEFQIKIMGMNNEDLIPEITAIIARFSEGFDPEQNIQIKHSKNSKFLGVTATINATSKQQLDEIYTLLNKHSLIKLTL